MNLCIVVHHRNDPRQPWANSWVDDDCIQVIQTTRAIGQFCSKAKEQNQKIFVHRCGWGGIRPTICCEANVNRVDPIDKKTCIVTFCDAKTTDREPTAIPGQGQNYYFEK